jgi:DNA primase
MTQKKEAVMYKKSHSIDVQQLKSEIDIKPFYEKELGIYLKNHTSKPWSLAGLCPFHADKQSGSFHVNLNTGAYKCFSCGMDGGDVIDFLCKRHQLSFKEAISELSRTWRRSC